MDGFFVVVVKTIRILRGPYNTGARIITIHIPIFFFYRIRVF